MVIGTTTRPGALTRDGYERLHHERLQHELAMLAMRTQETGLRGETLLRRRVLLLHMLVQSNR